MPARIDSYVAQTTGLLQFSGGGTQYVVQTTTGVLYLIYVDTGSDLIFKKSTDGGMTWSSGTAIFAGTIVALSVWYDRWSGIAAGKIHLAYTESGGSDVLYRSIDTESSDALATQTTIFNGTSSAAGGALSLTRTRGGNLLCRGCIDAGAEPFFIRSTDVGANWGSRNTTGLTAIATQDQYLMMPGFAADNQDALCIFWDASANAILRQVYDDSANTWSEASLASSMQDSLASGSFPHFAGAVDLTNSKIVLIAWNVVDFFNADLQCWTVDESAATAKTDVVTNSTDDQGLAAIGIDTDTGFWYAFYVGKSDGSETVGTAVNVYSKISKDSGSTWGSETLISNSARNVKWLCCTPRFVRPYAVAMHYDEASTIPEIRVSALVAAPHGIPGFLHSIEGGISA